MATKKELNSTQRLEFLASERVDEALAELREVVVELGLDPEVVGWYLGQLLGQDGAIFDKRKRERTRRELAKFGPDVDLAILERLVSILPKENGWARLDDLVGLWSKIDQVSDPDDLAERILELAYEFGVVTVDGGWVGFDRDAALDLECGPADGEKVAYEEISELMMDLTDEELVYFLQH